MVPEPLSLTVISIGLAKTCLEAFYFVDGLVHAGGTAATAAAMLLVERTKLRLWLYDLGLIDENGKPASAERVSPQLQIEVVGEAVVASLQQIKESIEKGDVLSSRYGLRRIDIEKDMLPTSNLQELILTTTQGKDDIFTKMRIHQRVRWQIDDERKFRLLLANLHYFIEALYKLLPPGERSTLSRAVYANVLARDSNVDALISAQGQPEQPNDDMVEFAKLKRMADELGASASTVAEMPVNRRIAMRIPRDRLKLPITLGTYSRNTIVADLNNADGEHKVLVEWRRINPAWSDRVRQLMWQRFDSIACLLQRSHEADVCFRALSCRGFVIESARDYMAFVSGIPAGISGSAVPRSLWSLLQEGPAPNLDARFDAAKAIAIAVHQIHATGWLHKNIRSSNIIIFMSSGSTEVTELNHSLLSPFLCGHGSSRLDLPDEATEKPITRGDGDFDVYVPVQYSSDVRYHRKFDIYSLGVVLYELAMWEGVEADSRLKTPSKDPHAKFQQRLRRRADKELGPEVGSTMKQVIIACLNAAECENLASDWLFWNVVRPLERCRL